MSRIGKQPIALPEAVEVTLAGSHLTVKGALGVLEHEVPGMLGVECADDQRTIEVRRRNDSRRARAMHGLHRTLIANKVQGVAVGFAKRLEIHGTGYSAELRGESLVLQIGFCHEVVFPLPGGISVDIEQRAAQPGNPARFVVRGIDKEQVGQFAAKVRAIRRPEPYKGKGIRYEGEYVRRKEGKAFTGLST
jgi:large subunit ribosomal protein L6